MTRSIRVGSLTIGGGSEVVIQSMTNTSTSDFESTIEQIAMLYEAGCKIVRLAVRNQADIEASRRILEAAPATLVADIQFDHRLAIAASEIGYKKIRINPGNIGGEQRLREVVAACKHNKTVIRVGSNSGSINSDSLKQYGNSARALAYSVMDNVQLLEKMGFYDIIISAKSSNVRTMIEASRLLNDLTDYPQHLGVTESGSCSAGVIKSSIGIGALLCDSIGDTIRVSLSAHPIEEVRAARQILRSVGLDKNYCEIISCPTCARCGYDLCSVVERVEALTAGITTPLKIAIMGCVVNGPGEAREADFGIAGGGKEAVVFQKGKVIRSLPFEDIYQELERFLKDYIR